MWSSLRDLTVSIDLVPLAESSIDSGVEAKNAECLDYWREVCGHLGAHLPPSQLRLHFRIFNVDVTMPNCNHDHLVTSVKNACSSMLKLPVLRMMAFEAHVGNSLGLQRTVTRLVNRLTYTRLPTERKYRSPFRFMDLPAEIQRMILEYAGLVAPGPVIPWMSKGYGLEDCYAKRCPRGELCFIETNKSIRYCSWDSDCWSLPADLFLVNRHISAMSAQILFSRNKFVVDLRQFTGPAPKGLIWDPTYTGNDPSPPRTPGLRHPQYSRFLCVFPPECIPMLRFLTWRFPICKCHNRVMLGKELKADWVRAVDFIAQNVEPLSRLTITLDMCYTDDYKDDDPMPTKSRNKVLLPLQRLRAAGLRNLFIHLSRDRTLREHAAEELRLERLAMGEGYHSTKEELESRIS
jgi:hypothetical protein